MTYQFLFFNRKLIYKNTIKQPHCLHSIYEFQLMSTVGSILPFLFSFKKFYIKKEFSSVLSKSECIGKAE